MSVGGACLPGYYYTAAGPSCTACTITGCLACTATECLSGAGACVTNKVISALVQATTSTCVNCTAANCWICDPWDAAWSATASTTTCAVCAPGYALNAAKTCVACPVNCTNVSSTAAPF